jgi:hypothetical protein
MPSLRPLLLAAALPLLAACSSHTARPRTDAVPQDCPLGYSVQVINPLNVDYDIVSWDRPGGASRVVGSVGAGERVTITLPPESRGQVMLRPSFDALHPVHYDPMSSNARPGSVTTRVSCL